MYKPQGQQPDVESYPEVVETGHVYHPYIPVDQKPQYPAPEPWSQLETAPAFVPISAPPPIESNTGEKVSGTVCGVRRRTFWLLVLLAIVIVLAAVGGGVGATLASKNKTPAAAVVTATVTNADAQTATDISGTATTTTNIPTSTATAPVEGGLEAQGQAIRTGLTAARYKAESDKWTPLGYQLTSISGYSFGITDVYSAIWELKVGPAVSTEYNLISSQYQTELDTMEGKGYFPVLVDAWTVNGAAHFGAIWMDSEGKTIPAWAARYDLTKTAFQTTHEKFVGQGYCIKGLSGYAQGTEARYTALWNECRDTNANATVLKYAIQPGLLQAQLDDMLAQGYKVSYINGYAVSNIAYYDVIYTLGFGTDWFMVFGMRATEFQAKMEEMSGMNYKVTILSGHTINNNFLYSAVWNR